MTGQLAYITLLGSGGPGIDNSLPGQGGNYPDHGLPVPPPLVDNSLPRPPPGVFPPPSISHPIVPVPPGTSVPPGVIWPPVWPNRPDNSLPKPPVRPDHSLPGSQPEVDNELPGEQPEVDNELPQQPPYPSHPIANNTYWMLCYTPNLGWKYVSVDPNLRPDQGLPQPQPTPTPQG